MKRARYSTTFGVFLRLFCLGFIMRKNGGQMQTNFCPEMPQQVRGMKQFGWSGSWTISTVSEEWSMINVVIVFASNSCAVTEIGRGGGPALAACQEGPNAARRNARPSQVRRTVKVQDERRHGGARLWRAPRHFSAEQSARRQSISMTASDPGRVLAALWRTAEHPEAALEAIDL